MHGDAVAVALPGAGEPTDRHPRGDADDPGHRRHRARELLAVAFVILQQEALHGIVAGARLRLEAVAELVAAQVLLDRRGLQRRGRLRLGDLQRQVDDLLGHVLRHRPGQVRVTRPAGHRGGEPGPVRGRVDARHVVGQVTGRGRTVLAGGDHGEGVRAVGPLPRGVEPLGGVRQRQVLRPEVTDLHLGADVGARSVHPRRRGQGVALGEVERGVLPAPAVEDRQRRHPQVLAPGCGRGVCQHVGVGRLGQVASHVEHRVGELDRAGVLVELPAVQLVRRRQRHHEPDEEGRGERRDGDHAAHPQRQRGDPPGEPYGPLQVTRPALGRVDPVSEQDPQVADRHREDRPPRDVAQQADRADQVEGQRREQGPAGAVDALGQQVGEDRGDPDGGHQQHRQPRVGDHRRGVRRHVPYAFGEQPGHPLARPRQRQGDREQIHHQRHELGEEGDRVVDPHPAQRQADGTEQHHQRDRADQVRRVLGERQQDQRREDRGTGDRAGGPIEGPDHSSSPIRDILIQASSTVMSEVTRTTRQPESRSTVTARSWSSRTVRKAWSTFPVPFTQPSMSSTQAMAYAWLRCTSTIRAASADDIRPSTATVIWEPTPRRDASAARLRSVLPDSVTSVSWVIASRRLVALPRSPSWGSASGPSAPNRVIAYPSPRKCTASEAVSDTAHSKELSGPVPRWACSRESSSTVALGSQACSSWRTISSPWRAVERQWIRRTSSPRT
ncbi:hypothetical protein SDC9_84495 [bioreactor metagenome]|uniref:Uncharacterized protein n=1 Tax=bioreactor metagenome TaxID=1076179 RepID=A0A644ZAG4_9ZZZZ